MQLLLAMATVVAGLYLFRRWSLRVGPARTVYAVRWIGVFAVLVLLLVIGMRGGGSLVGPLLMLFVPLLIRWHQLWHPPPAVTTGQEREPASDSKSTVKTQFLNMSLDHVTGEMQGTVVAGSYRGREVSDLSEEELWELWQECGDDPQSVAVLEAYLQRNYGEDWRSWGDEYKGRQGHEGVAMSREEAYAILGLGPDAGVEEIKGAHRRLMQRLHPDQGGSTYLAARVNRAKDILLGK